jgi:23S rRNA G2445 N2-methylase RlmL
VLAEARGIAPDARVVAQGERFAIVELPAAAVARLVSQARTIDDLRLLVAGPATVDTEQDFVLLCERAADQTLELLGSERQSVRPWSVTVSARDPVWRRSPAWSASEIISARLHGADTRGTVRSAVDLRIQVDRRQAHIALNLGRRPLGKRDDGGQAGRPGALRPTVAAALVRLAMADVDLGIAARGVYDPFCGSGTIVAEAMQLGLPVFGSDIDEGAVLATRARISSLADGRVRGNRADDLAADLMHRVFRHDVLSGVPGRVTASIVASNLPWGKQVKVARHGELFDRVAAIVADSIGRGGGCALLTTHEDQLAASLRRRGTGARISSRRIGLLGQTPGIVVASAGQLPHAWNRR